MLDLATVRQSWRDWLSPFQAYQCTPAWLQYFWTFFFNLAIAAVLTLISWGFARNVPLPAAFKWNFVIAQSIGYSIHLLFDLGGRLLGQHRFDRFSVPQRTAYFISIPIVGCLIGYSIGLTLLGVDVARLVQGAPRIVVAIVVISIVVSTFWYRYTAGKARLAEAEAQRERERARVVELERQNLDAQLRSLQAQIEPHFLFNTLANVVSLIETAPASAKLMLERLIELLRSSLAATRSASTTLGQEAALLVAYLDVLGVRMGQRLRYRIDIPLELAGAAIPPLSLQPLVENAIKHGLEPKVEGGSVRISARAQGDRLIVEIEDDGLGFATAQGGGVGLVNLRQRLASRYGERAQLIVEELPKGTRVQLVVPLT